LILLFEKERA